MALNRRAFSTILAASVLLTPAARAQSRCAPVATVPVQVREGFPFVPASIGGRPVSLLLDTGAQRMLVTPEAAARLALPRAPGRIRVYGTGGSQEVQAVAVRGLRLGAAVLPDQDAPVVPLPSAVPAVEPPLAGLLGASLLAAFDLELDGPAGQLRLHPPGACPLPAGALPLEVTPEGEAFLRVQVNGVTLLALLDTGSRATLLTEAAARRLGLDAPVSANTAWGVDGQRLPLRHVRVRELRVGAEMVADAPVSVAPLTLGRGDMLLGMDVLGRRRVWISYAAGRVVIGPPP